jgi:hypothetical protein
VDEGDDGLDRGDPWPIAAHVESEASRGRTGMGAGVSQRARGTPCGSKADAGVTAEPRRADPRRSLAPLGMTTSRNGRSSTAIGVTTSENGFSRCRSRRTRGETRFPRCRAGLTTSENGFPHCPSGMTTVPTADLSRRSDMTTVRKADLSRRSDMTTVPTADLSLPLGHDNSASGRSLAAARADNSGKG